MSQHPPRPLRPDPADAPGGAERIACPDCGLAQTLPHVSAGALAECARCRKQFAQPHPASIDAALAFSAGALLLWLPAAATNLMLVSSSGAVREGGLADGVHALWVNGYPLLALLVATLSLAIPSVYLVLLPYVLLRVRAGGLTERTGGRIGALFRWVTALRPWMMLDVYFLGCCVAYERLQQVATVSIGTAGWCLIAVTLLLLLALAALDERTVWNALPVRAGAQPRSTHPAHVLSCLVCDLMQPASHAGGRCPRCHATLHLRKRAALQRTSALVLCGFLLYVPANLLPVLSIERYGQVEHDTILRGVWELAENGLWLLAAIVFTASIVIPLAKLCALTWNLLLTSVGSPRALVLRTRLHRFIDRIGRWSNIDVFMVSILVALVQFGVLTHVRAQPGIVAFAAVVVITMIAAQCFDSRLMWDAAGERS